MELVAVDVFRRGRWGVQVDLMMPGIGIYRTALVCISPLVARQGPPAAVSVRIPLGGGGALVVEIVACRLGVQDVTCLEYHALGNCRRWNMGSGPAHALIACCASRS